MQSSFNGDASLGYVQFAAGSLATPQPLVVPVGTTVIELRCEAQAVRFRDDGVNPTATVGFPLAVGEVMQYTSSSSPSFRVIEQVGGAVLNVIFYGAKT